MKTNVSRSPFPQHPVDVAVIGGGLAGLTAAVTVAKRGHSVVLVERGARVGGLCGSFALDGRVFVRACNELGGGVGRVLRELGVGVNVVPSSARVFLPEGPIHIPPRPGDLPVFARHAPGLARFVSEGSKVRNNTVFDALSGDGADPWVRSLFAFVAGAAATPPGQLRLSDFVDFVQGGFGWHAPVKVLGGPQAVVDALLATACGLGARVFVETTAGETRRVDGGFELESTRGPLRAREVITSAPRWDAYPKTARPGLGYGTALLSLARDVPFPSETTTIHYVPPSGLHALERVGAGTLPDDFGFLLTRQVGAPPEGRAIVAFFALPLVHWHLDDATRTRIASQLLDVGDRLMPGLATAISRLRVVSPAEFEAQHGFEPRSVRLTLPPGEPKPPERDPATGLHHVGVSVGPTGADGAAAVFSGRRVGDAVARRLT